MGDLRNRPLRRAVIALAMLVAALLSFAAGASAATQVTVQPGETITSLAARYGVSAASIVAVNGIGDADVIAAGRTIAIPSAGVGGTTAYAGAGGGYTVRAGETLSGIANRHGTSVQALVQANGLSSAHLIIAGTRLRITGGGGGGSGAGGYTVRFGETLSGIANRHGTSVQALVQANGLSSAHLIIAGTRLRITGGGMASPASSGGAGGYAVLPGENLGAIAARHGTSAQALAAANGISDPNLVVAGTRIQIPGGSASPGGLTPVTAASSGWGSQPSKSDVAALMAQYAARHGVDPSLVRAVGWQESGWWQGARSATGAIGVMQLMPETAAWAGPSLLGRSIDPHDVSDNIEAGVAYLGYLQRRTGSQRLAIASYYQGLDSVAARGFYDDTTSYVDSVSSFIGRV